MKTVIITGASSGIGENLARLFSSKSYEVCLIGRNKERLEKVKASLEGPAVALPVDLYSPSALEQIKQGLSEDFLSRLHILVNNAGEFTRKPLAELSSEDFQKQYKLQVEVPALLSQFCYPYLSKHQSGSSILNVSSSLGLDPVAETAHYSAAKAAMVNLTKAMAIEFAPVRVNCVCPGIVDTPIHSFSDEVKSEVDKLQALGRIGQPQDISEACFFLASNSSQWTTGASLLVDGGINLRK